MDLFHKKKVYEEVKLISDKKVPFPYIEAYKSLRTNLNFISSANGARVFVMTSALPEEGKSSVSINTALALATGGKRVLLIDCDLRRPSLTRILKLGRVPQGLTNVLTGANALEECIVRIKNTSLEVLTAGMMQQNPSELLATERMKQLLQLLRERYDFVILDAPPVSLVTDAAVLGGISDGAILVVRSKYADSGTVQLAKRKLQDVGVNIWGVVLNRFDAKRVGHRSGYSDAYGYDYGRS